MRQCQPARALDGFRGGIRRLRVLAAEEEEREENVWGCGEKQDIRWELTGGRDLSLGGCP